MPVLLPEMPDAATVRVFCASRPLSADDLRAVAAALTAFIPTWMSHDTAVRGAWALMHDRFVVVAADESKTHLSGCSKDSVVRTVRGLESSLGAAFVATPPIAYRHGAEIRNVTREAFADLAASGAVTPETIVFDMTVQTLGDIRAGRFETAAKDAWHARAFDFATRA